MTRHTAIFDRYRFINDQVKIILKNVRIIGGKKESMEEAYIEANDVPSLIGDLAYQDPISFVCKSIENNRIIDPTEFYYKKVKE